MELSQKVKIFRSRFAGRQDVFSRKWRKEDKDGVIRANYAPVCENLWKDFCHLKLKDNKTCQSCDNKVYTRVSDESVAKHIRGDEEHSMYVLLEDGTINFGAIDFDYKEGKEEQGYTWEDIKAVSKVLDDWGLPHGLARSTTMGYHVYFFFDGNRCAANLFRSLMYEVFHKAGFIMMTRQKAKPLPEIFPKQSYTTTGIGNCIKPPMVEPRWPFQRNGFVDKNGEFIDPSKQWQHLDSIPRISQEQIKKIIEDEDVHVIEETMTSAQLPSSMGQQFQSQSLAKKAWQPPLIGSIEKVLEGCKAMRAVKEKCDKGVVLGHDEGFALFHLAMATADGRRWFLQNVPGWGKTEADIRQLDASLGKNYSPHTCAKMQQLGICAQGTKCFNRKPPVDIVEGQYVVKHDTPKDRWPEPSPIRYAYGSGEDFLLKLMQDATALSSEKNESTRMAKLDSLVQRAQAFDSEQLKDFEKHVKTLKLATRGQINEMMSEHEDTRKREMQDELSVRADTVTVNEDTYQKLEPFGYGIINLKKKKSPGKRLCSFDIIVEEIRAYQEEDHTMRATYLGRCLAHGMNRLFEISSDKWYDNSKFIEFFGQVLGQKFLVHRSDIEHIKNAAMAFSDKQGMTATSFLMTQGWYEDTYVMPSYIVDKDGVKPNSMRRVDLTNKQIASALDFKLDADSDFRNTLHHVKVDFLDAWPRKWSMFALSHTLMAGLMTHLGIRKKPSLFYEGLTGTGKTELIQTVAYFWGDFKRIANLSSTGLGIQEAAYDFKDALLVIDDYKGASHQEKQALERSIQYSYDEGSTRLKMSRNGSQAPAKESRALLMFTGEEFLSSDSAKVSRCIIIEVHKTDLERSRPKYLSCIEHRRNYSAITPRFLSWFLNQNIPAIKDRMNDIEDRLHAIHHGKTNANRIAYNLSRSRIVFELFCEFMMYHNIAIQSECEELLAEHWKYVLEINDNMTDKCEDSQNGVVFAKILRTLIETKEVLVSGLYVTAEEEKNSNKKIIGYVRPTVKGGVAVFLYPDKAFKEIKQYGEHSFSLTGSDRAITRQLTELGIIQTYEEGSRIRSTTRKTVDGLTRRVWRINAEKLNLKIENADDAGEVNESGIL